MEALSSSRIAGAAAAIIAVGASLMGLYYFCLRTSGKCSRQKKGKGAVIFMISGDRSQVGKSSVCLGIIGGLIKAGLAKAKEVGYIKPATQCEKPTLISKFCRSKNIDSKPIGPIVYFSGFTRSFLEGKQGTSKDMLELVEKAVSSLSQGKKFIIVDGVGYPAVGSICGVSNAHIAAALNIPVLLVGKKGVGDAVDSTNLNKAFFENKGVRVLGSVFNKIPDDGSYYSLGKIKKSVLSYFNQFDPKHKVYGFIPEITELKNANSKPTAPSSKERAPGVTKVTLKASDDVRMSPEETKISDVLISAFDTHVDLKAILSGM
ncbi:hypothetical protein AAMO2058_000083200 [Amorphochlora amoebiformis]